MTSDTLAESLYEAYRAARRVTLRLHELDSNKQAGWTAAGRVAHDITAARDSALASLEAMRVTGEFADDGSLRSEVARAARRDYEQKNEIARLRAELDKAMVERDNAVEKIAFMRDEWSLFSARPCPACLYIGGVYQRPCKLHEAMESFMSRMPTDAERASLSLMANYFDASDPTERIGLAWIDRMLAGGGK